MLWYSENGDLNKALDYYEEAFLIRKKVLGDGHVEVAQVRSTVYEGIRRNSALSQICLSYSCTDPK